MRVSASDSRLIARAQGPDEIVSPNHTRRVRACSDQPRAVADRLKRVKADERTRVIPVVMVTSSAEGRDIIESYKLGVNSYLVKPVEFEQFSDTVAKAGLYWMLMNKTPE